MQTHTNRLFEQKLKNLKIDIITMGQTCERQLSLSVDSLTEQDDRMAEVIISNDTLINEQQSRIEADTIHAIAKWQPVAVDLRFLISALKISADLERIGDYTANIAKRRLRIHERIDQEPLTLISDMAQACLKMLNGSIRSLQDNNVDKAISVWHEDEDIDTLFSRLINLIAKALKKTSGLTDQYTHLLFMARCFERIGDHIKNVVENITYIYTGELYTAEA